MSTTADPTHPATTEAAHVVEPQAQAPVAVVPELAGTHHPDPDPTTARSFFLAGRRVAVTSRRHQGK